ncbi:DUF1616 domain-containing protein [Pelotomaculum propionicicum]|uniref:DUF1616 domain-containing protein n=1 Tax=Pelotomaculum propionicicum TaxID=258475 RepID=UPI003B772360
MKLEIKNELVFAFLISAALAGAVLMDDRSSVRVVLGLLSVLFLPGYALVAAMFPQKEDLDGIERLALAFGLSIVVVPILGFLLNYTPWGISPYPVLLALLAFTTVMSAAALYRRSKIPAGLRFKMPVAFKWPGFAGMGWVDRALFTALAGAVLFTAGSIYHVAATPVTGEQFTEFYILSPGGKAGGYPSKITAGAETEVTLGIVNNEYRPVSYSAEIVIDGRLEKKLAPVDLSHGEKWESRVTFSAVEPQNNVKVEFLLYLDGESAPYRSLHLWVNAV